MEPEVKQDAIRLLGKTTSDKVSQELRPVIVHSDGTWLVNTGGFPFWDPENQVRFEPGQPTKARVSAWLSQQPVISEVTDMEKPVSAPIPTSAVKK